MKNSVRRGALIIAAGGLVSKIIGAIYRVPLTNLIGAEGIGLYQMVFPVYCALLTLSSTGLPTALSKLVAGGEDKEGYLSVSLFIFGAIGLIGSTLMLVLGGIFAKWQGNYSAAVCYRALAPSVFLVSIISCFRGYFQGREDMAPTAVSQVIEQVAKTAFGLIACYFFRENVTVAAAMATLAVTVSEVAALAFLCVKIKLSGFRLKGKSNGGLVKKILSVTVPVALSAIILPLGHVADSFIVINIMGRYTSDATSIFGLYSGSVAAIIGVPVSLAYGAAVAGVPALSRGECEEKIVESMRFTGFIAIPFWLYLTFFSPWCIDFLYGGLSLSMRRIASGILGLDAVGVLLTSFLQTTNAILLARGRQKIPLISMSTALVIRVALCIILVSAEGVGIYGAVIAANLSNLIALAVNLYFAIPAAAVFSVLLDVSKIAFASVICVLFGFSVLNYLDGKLAFVIVSALSAGAYLLLGAALSRIKFKNNSASDSA